MSVYLVMLLIIGVVGNLLASLVLFIAGLLL